MNTVTEPYAAYYAEAEQYLKILEGSRKRQSRFDNALLYNIVTLCSEKLWVALLAWYGETAIHHTPMALYNQAAKRCSLPVSFRETARLINRYESICLFDDLGYRTPDDAALTEMIDGLSAVKKFVDQTLNKGEISQ